MRHHLIATVAMRAAGTVDHWFRLGRKLQHRISRLPAICWGRHPASVSGPAIIVFPCAVNRLCCGLAGIIAVKGSAGRNLPVDPSSLDGIVDKADGAGLGSLPEKTEAIVDGYLGGRETLDTLLVKIRSLKQEGPFLGLFKDAAAQRTLARSVRQAVGDSGTGADAPADRRGSLKRRRWMSSPHASKRSRT
jgi:hypothetical protein